MIDEPLDPPWKTIGFWCAIIMGAAQAISAARAFIDPVGFSSYMGLPTDANGTGFVTVYALRTTLIAALAFYLAITRRFSALGVIAVVALILPLGDAWLSSSAGADKAIVFRHLGIAVFLAFTAAMLLRDSNRGTNR